MQVFLSSFILQLNYFHLLAEYFTTDLIENFTNHSIDGSVRYHAILFVGCELQGIIESTDCWDLLNQIDGKALYFAVL